MATLSLAACEDVKIAPNGAGEGAVARGKLAAQRLGCGSCHTIPGIWPSGTTGPALISLSDRGLIAGKVPNKANALAGYIFDPAGTVPDTSMPRVPMTRQDASDIAAFLHSTNAR